MISFRTNYLTLLLLFGVSGAPVYDILVSRRMGIQTQKFCSKMDIKLVSARDCACATICAYSML